MAESILTDVTSLVGDPVGADALGRQAAKALADTTADAVLVDTDLGSVVLGHITARELGVPAAVVSVDLGLLEIAPPLAAGAKVAIVSRDLPDYPKLGALCSYLQDAGHPVVGIVSGRPVLDADLPVTPVQLLG